MNRERRDFMLVLLFTVALAVAAYFGQELVRAWFEGRREVVTALGDLALNRAAARQMDAVSTILWQQSTVLLMLVVVGAAQGVVAVVALVLAFSRRHTAGMRPMLGPPAEVLPMRWIEAELVRRSATPYQRGRAGDG